MSDEKVPAEYSKMDLQKAKEFDKKVRQNFMPAIISTVRQIVEDYGPLEGVCVDVGAGTALFAIELGRRTALKIYALEIERPIYEVARENIEEAGLGDRIVPVLGDAHDLPFDDNFADFIISRGAYHCWADKVRVFREVYRVLKKGGIAFVGGGFGRYVSEEDLKRMKALRDRSLGEAAKAYASPEGLEEVLKKANIPSYRIIPDRVGFWAEIKK
jgi:ubiquinone/menaquinone biosynthesis C-methylase UbiE